MKTSTAIINALAVVSIAGTAYWMGTQQASVNAPVKEVIEIREKVTVFDRVPSFHQADSEHRANPSKSTSAIFPSFNLGSFTGHKFWEGDVTTEEVHFKIKLNKNQRLSIIGTPIYSMHLADADSNSVECQPIADNCNVFVVPVSGPYEIVLTYRTTMGYDSAGTLSKPDPIRSSVEFNVTDAQQ